MSTCNNTMVWVCVLALAANTSFAEEQQLKGPLRTSAANPRYFADRDGRVVYLTGSHTWCNLQDMSPADPPDKFDFDGYLDFQDKHGHNFIRLWRWELLRWDTSANRAKTPRVHVVAPHPWSRLGPSRALDGKPRFDLQQFDESYFARLRERVEKARDRGKYVSVMLFEGWGLQHLPDAWKLHPFYPDNNRNDVGRDVVEGVEIHTLKHRRVTDLQEAYVRKVIQTVNELDNVLYEIGNETGSYSTAWQEHMIRFVHQIEREMPKQHPVGMTFQWSRDPARQGTHAALYDSSADWISPGKDPTNRGQEWIYGQDPRVADGRKVMLVDTDHIWGIGGNADWVWRTFLRGLNPIFMDPYQHRVLDRRIEDEPTWELSRRAMGQTRYWADRVDLALLKPTPHNASTEYCLSQPGQTYLVYQPDAGQFDVNLEAGRYVLEWFNPAEGASTQAGTIRVAAKPSRFTPPFDGPAVLLLEAMRDSSELE